MKYKKLQKTLHNNIILFTFHPETLNAKQTIKNISICLESLKYFKNFQINSKLMS